MHYNIIKRNIFYSIIGAVLCNYCIYSQDCDAGYTYFDEIPEHVTNINNDNNCFYDEDIAVINDLISLNSLCIANKGDLSGDNSQNVMDIVQLANCILSATCGGDNAQTGETGIEFPCAADMNGDNLYNVIDVVVLCNCILAGNCGNYQPSQLIGPQTWVTSRLTDWVLTYTPNGSNGINQQLVELPDNFGNLTDLSSLYLEWNLLTELPSSFAQLSNLTNLAISNNYLASLPDLSNFINLYYFDLGYNQIASIPESIGSLQNLVFLYLLMFLVLYLFWLFLPLLYLH